MRWESFTGHQREAVFEWFLSLLRVVYEKFMHFWHLNKLWRRTFDVFMLVFIQQFMSHVMNTFDFTSFSFQCILLYSKKSISCCHHNSNLHKMKFLERGRITQIFFRGFLGWAFFRYRVTWTNKISRLCQINLAFDKDKLKQVAKN